MASSIARLAALTAIVFVVSSCRLPDPAPEDLSALLTFSFSHYDPEDWTNDISLADAAVNLEQWFAEEVEGAEDFDPAAGFDARLTEANQRLTNDDLGGLSPAPEVLDGPAAAGVVVALETRCRLDELDAIYLDPDQMSYFPDNYVEYSRSQQEGLSCFPQGDCLEASWRTHIVQEQTFPAAVWEATIDNRMRRLEATAPGGEEVHARMTRSWMTEPAVITPSSLGSFLQNYQLEFTIERPGGGTLHVYPQWVHFELGQINTEAAVFLNAYINGMRDYLRTLETHCEGS
ncbi:MAG: hypothetical protein VX498_05135 [Myxococcota bacterium]|nr:hypothetical protein [Myxococcota bacterium]